MLRDKKIDLKEESALDLSTFAVKLPVFEGPFDLLLFFIEQEELDIHDIPIAHVTRRFFSYMRTMDHMNISLGSEFIYVAARLMQIKARLLLPIREALSDEADAEDPRADLVAHLLAYKRYKMAAEHLSSRAEARSMQHKRGHLKTDIQNHIQADPKTLLPHHLDLYDLVRAYARVLQDHAYRQKEHQVRLFPYSVSEEKQRIKSKLRQKKRLSFMELVGKQRERLFVVFNLLALLELCQQERLRIDVAPDYSNFWIALITAE